MNICKEGMHKGDYELPHIDQVLCQCHRLCVSCNRDCSVHVGVGTATTAAQVGIPVFTVGYADHGSTQLPAISILLQSKHLPNT